MTTDTSNPTTPPPAGGERTTESERRRLADWITGQLRASGYTVTEPKRDQLDVRKDGVWLGDLSLSDVWHHRWKGRTSGEVAFTPAATDRGRRSYWSDGRGRYQLNADDLINVASLRARLRAVLPLVLAAQAQRKASEARDAADAVIERQLGLNEEPPLPLGVKASVFAGKVDIEAHGLSPVLAQLVLTLLRTQLPARPATPEEPEE